MDYLLCFQVLAGQPAADLVLTAARRQYNVHTVKSHTKLLSCPQPLLAGLVESLKE